MDNKKQKYDVYNDDRRGWVLICRGLNLYNDGEMKISNFFACISFTLSLHASACHIIHNCLERCMLLHSMLSGAESSRRARAVHA
jgi:hypothetical protein